MDARQSPSSVCIAICWTVGVWLLREVTQEADHPYSARQGVHRGPTENVACMIVVYLVIFAIKLRTRLIIIYVAEWQVVSGIEWNGIAPNKDPPSSHSHHFIKQAGLPRHRRVDLIKS